MMVISICIVHTRDNLAFKAAGFRIVVSPEMINSIVCLIENCSIHEFNRIKWMIIIKSNFQRFGCIYFGRFGWCAITIRRPYTEIAIDARFTIHCGTRQKSHRLGREINQHARHYGHLAKGSIHLDVFGANIQFGRYHETDASRRTQFQSGTSMSNLSLQ